MHWASSEALFYAFTTLDNQGIALSRGGAVDDFHIIESANEYGVARDIRIEGDNVVTKQTYDAAPLLKFAADARIANEGKRWGDGHFVGVIPMAELTRINDTFKSAEERKHQILLWLKNNPKLVTFDKFLK